ncbi:phosphoribosyltransferase [Candidatus Korarchaeum cryptofilum]|uniref:Phosphoribosyltransferase n=1 Tax=Korarchaeum cryptofilum (strain OPF8) TaxID=374847 RepID=B1L6A4_KORCO|nr:phosphoribosyltransferase [Candidatus Korarchaeum cryptofilum]ACB07983.1 phosphoribosyltransferase [Candidatus Korarchaeum cryptofilum OPF8]
MDFINVSPEDALLHARRIAEKIVESKYEPELIVAILRGGVVLARLLSDLLNIREIKVMRVIHYDALESKKVAEIVEPINCRLDGMKVLLVDDVADTGESLIVARDHLLERGASEVKIATMHYKPWSKLKPDYYSEETEAWVVYFWEYAETVKYFLRKFQDKGENFIFELIRRAKIPEDIVKWVIEGEGGIR